MAVVERRVLWLRGPHSEIAGDLQVNGIGLDDRMSPGLVDRPKGTDDFLFMHFPTPVVVHHEGALRPFPPHTFFLWRPGRQHTFGNPRRPWSHTWMHCAGGVVERAITSSGLPCDRPIPFADGYTLHRLLESLFIELETFSAPDPAIVAGYVGICAHALAREADPHGAPTRLPKRLVAVLRHIEANLSQPIALVDLAARAALSIPRFSAEFRTHLGVSPMRYVQGERLRLARHLLRDRGLRITDVAERVGFSDPFYFSRSFTAAFGISPQRFRRRVGGESG